MRPILVIAALAVATSSAQSQASPAGSLPTPPAKIGPYTRNTSENLGPAAGMVHRYSGGTSGNVNVYIYPVPADVKEGTADSRTWTNREGAKFKEVLALMKSQNAIQDFTVAIERPDSAMNAAEVIPGHFTSAVVRRSGATSVEMIIIYFVKGVFLKVRASLPADTYRTADAPGFGEAIARAVASGGP